MLKIAFLDFVVAGSIVFHKCIMWLQVWYISIKLLHLQSALKQYWKRTDTVTFLGQKKNMRVYCPSTDPNFWHDLKFFYGTSRRKLFENPIFAFQFIFFYV